ncbi:hypothetical protein J6S35_00820, partial [Candidatus Saccharibacteria bacterium]|nr:hypothetical protein [Candidatus Saccharibacteria bacterium]
SLISTSGNQGSTRANDILHQFPFSLPYSGNVYSSDGKVINQGTAGYFWSAGSVSVGSDTYARYLRYFDIYTLPEFSSPKTSGFSVRCVAQ